MIQQDIILVPTMEVSVGWAVDAINPNDQAQVLVNIGMEFVRLYNALGGQIAVGNAYNFLGNRAGVPLREMELLQAAGMTPMEVIVAATRNSARACGQGDSLGTLEAGKLADVIVVAGNPLDDLRALENIRFVVLGGQITVERYP
jgi:imidazolonepropionase-like amidohydrolase